jgi:hypothetical protein
MTLDEVVRRLFDLERDVRATRLDAAGRSPRILAGGGGGGGKCFVTADSKAELPDVDSPKLGWVSPTNRMYYRYGTKDDGSWICHNFLEVE